MSRSVQLERWSDRGSGSRWPHRPEGTIVDCAVGHTAGHPVGKRRAIEARSAPRAIPLRRLAARAHVELVENVRDVPFGGVRRKIERAGDQLVAVASGNAGEYLELAGT